MERETGIEPATFSLARRRSTAELLSHINVNFTIIFLQGKCLTFRGLNYYNNVVVILKGYDMGIINLVIIIAAILMVVSILLQERGTTLGGAFGGEGNVYSGRRGAEKFLFYSTIVFAVIFVGLAIVNLFI